MKLALIIEHFDASRGGTERLAAWVAHEMARRGHDVHVICHDLAPRVSRFRQATLRASFDAHRSRRHGTPDPAAPPNASAAAGARLHIHRLRGMRLHSALGFRLFGRRAAALGRKLNCDAVHSFTVACPGDIYHAHAGVFAAMQAQALAKRAGTAAGAWKRLLLRLGKQRTLLKMEHRALTEARRIISACTMITEQFVHHYGTRGNRILTLPTPRLDQDDDISTHVDATIQDRAWFRSHYGIAPADRVALFIGHDFRRKGLRQAIEALARTPDWKLVVVGLGRVREYVELAQRLHLIPGPSDQPAETAPARVLFVGPTRELPAIYAAGDALLLPAFYEPSGIVALEALGHGLPVISTVFLGIADLILAYRAGTIIADPHDAAALAAALQNLPRAESAEGRALAQRARAASASLTPNDFADRLESLYREVSPSTSHK